LNNALAFTNQLLDSLYGANASVRTAPNFHGLEWFGKGGEHGFQLQADSVDGIMQTCPSWVSIDPDQVIVNGFTMTCEEGGDFFPG
jgi:hypothetical protein